MLHSATLSGVPSKHRITVVLSDQATLDELERRAAADGRSASAYARRIIERDLSLAAAIEASNPSVREVMGGSTGIGEYGVKTEADAQLARDAHKAAQRAKPVKEKVVAPCPRHGEEHCRQCGTGRWKR